MDDVGVCEWIRRCSARLQAQWRTVDPDELEQVAVDLLRDARLRAMAPEQAAVAWLSLGVLLRGGDGAPEEVGCAGMSARVAG